MGLPGHHANHKRPDAESASAAVKGIRSGSERENQETAVDAAGPASIDCQTARYNYFDITLTSFSSLASTDAVPTSCRPMGEWERERGRGRERKGERERG